MAQAHKGIAQKILLDWREFLVAVFSITATSLFTLDMPVAAEEFVPGCTLPFESIAQKQPIDQICPAEGKAGEGKRREQNIAKNNFCAAGTPVTITYATFKGLQKASDNKLEEGKFPPDRSILKDIYKMPSGPRIGEGILVRYVGFVNEARNSNTSKGESVNCSTPGKTNNDIHIEMGQKTKQPACLTVTAEMTPHFRPEVWNVENLERVKGHPIRFTGQLFYDASHRPCKSVNDTKASPKRMTIWEIHPLYAIDVCLEATMSQCPAENEAKWVALDKWLGKEEEEDGEQ